MKNTKSGLLRRLAAAFLVAVLVVAPLTIMSAEAAPAAPKNVWFARWDNTSFTACTIGMNNVSGVDGYQSVWCWTDGSHAKYNYWGTKGNYMKFTGLPKNHVSQVRVRSVKVLSSGRLSYSAWSKIAFITPSPVTVKVSVANGNASNLQARLKWNPVYGSSGYNVFLTSNPYGTWYWNQSTNTKALSTSAVVKVYLRKKLKPYTIYYYRIITRRTYQGVFCTVPMPSSSFYNGAFRFRKY